MKINCVLLIDDNEIDNFINKHLLSKYDTIDNIIVKKSAIDALEYLKLEESSIPDIIFLDIQMPIMDGFVFLEQFSILSKTKKLKSTIYMLSSSNNLKDIEKATNNPFVKKYFDKPLTREKIENILTTIY